MYKDGNGIIIGKPRMLNTYIYMINPNIVSTVIAISQKSKILTWNIPGF